MNLTPFALSVGNQTMPSSTELWTCMDTSTPMDGSISGNPWGCHVVLSAGFVVTFLITLPMGYFNLDDIMWVQVVAFVLTLMCWAVPTPCDLIVPCSQEILRCMDPFGFRFTTPVLILNEHSSLLG